MVDRSADDWRSSSKLVRLLNSCALVVTTVLLLHCWGEYRRRISNRHMEITHSPAAAPRTTDLFCVVPSHHLLASAAL